MGSVRVAGRGGWLTANWWISQRRDAEDDPKPVVATLIEAVVEAVVEAVAPADPFQLPHHPRQRPVGRGEIQHGRPVAPRIPGPRVAVGLQGGGHEPQELGIQPRRGRRDERGAERRGLRQASLLVHQPRVADPPDERIHQEVVIEIQAPPHGLELGPPSAAGGRQGLDGGVFLPVPKRIGVIKLVVRLEVGSAWRGRGRHGGAYRISCERSTSRPRLRSKAAW